MRRSVSWVLSAAACGALGVGCGDQTGGDVAVPARFQALASAVEAERVAGGVPGVAIAIVEKGEVTFARGFGSKDPTRADAPVKPTTLFRIGSLTKALTAVALLQTVQAGQVDLQKPVIEYLPGFHLAATPQPVSRITVRHLLTHSSGIFDYLEIDAPADEKTDASLEAFLTGRFADVGYVQSPPGAFYAYANPGYMLAGLIAQTVTVTPYRNLMHDRVFAPLGMTRTVFLPAEVLADGDYASGKTCDATDVACGVPDIGPVVRPDSYDNPWGRPAGYAWSSVLDLAKLARFLVHGKPTLLRDDLWTTMTSPQAPMPQTGGLASYGYGTVVSPGFALPGSPANAYYGLKLLWHDGAIAGFSSYLACLPERDFCFISLASGDGASFQNSLVTAIETLVDLPAQTTPPDTQPRPERYPDYAGTYDDPHALGEFRVTSDGNRLVIQTPNADQTTTTYELKPTIVDNFVATIDGTPTPATFIPDSSGRYTYIYSRPYVAVRVPSPGD